MSAKKKQTKNSKQKRGRTDSDKKKTVIPCKKRKLNENQIETDLNELRCYICQAEVFCACDCPAEHPVCYEHREAECFFQATDEVKMVESFINNGDEANSNSDNNKNNKLSTEEILKQFSSQNDNETTVSKFNGIDLNSLRSALTLEEFMKATHTAVPTIFQTKFWKTVKMHNLILLDDNIVKWCGYKGDKSRQQRFNMKQALDNNNIPYFIIKLAEIPKSEYSDFAKRFPSVIRPVDRSKLQLIFVTGESFKELMMVSATLKAREIRKNYVMMEQIWIHYSLYQQIQQNTVKDAIIKDHEEQMARIEALFETTHNKLDESMKCQRYEASKAEQFRQEMKYRGKRIQKLIGNVRHLIDSRTAKPSNQQQKKTNELFVLVKLYDGAGFPADTPPEKKYEWYMIRGQERYVNGRLQQLRRQYPKIQREKRWNVNSSVEFANKVKEELIRHNAYNPQIGDNSNEGASWNLFNTSQPRRTRWMHGIINQVLRELRNVNGQQF